MKLKRWLYLVHRWLGIPLCVVMAAWFLSGMVMLYVGYPKLTPDERLAGLPPLPVDGCCVPLARALAAAAGAPPAASAPRAGQAGAAALQVWRLTSVAGQPRYVFGDGGAGTVAVDARTGTRIGPVDAAQALAAARHFAHGVPAEHRGVVQEDAWTHSRALDGHRPLHVVAVADAAQRWLYLSSHTGEVVRDATRTERTWGWVGAWLHWLYLFRGGSLNGWWADIVIWLSIAGAVAALTGAVVGVLRWRWRGTPYRSGRRTPYAGKAARWHHWLGLAGGALALTWVVSGLLSMNPWQLFDSGGLRPDRRAYAGGALQADAAPDAARALAWWHAQGVAPRELEWQRVGGVHLVIARDAGLPRVLDAQGPRPQGLDEATWLVAAARLLPHARIASRERLSAYDAHYYAREPHTMTGQRERPLPAERLVFDDVHATWVTIDPHTGAVLQVSDRLRRIDRWLFAFLHSFDLPLLLAARPAWDLWMLGFSLAGLGLSLTAVVTGTRRLLRPWRRPAHLPLPADAVRGGRSR